jgi:NitT/TauT family transport system substrate-binding protein
MMANPCAINKLLAPMGTLKMRWVGVILALLGGSFCPQATAAGSNEVIRIGYSPNITHAQALYAKATGAFEKQTGSAIKWVSFNAGPTAMESLFANAVDATFIGPGPTINGYLKSRGEKFVIVSGAASGGAGLVVRSGSGIQSEKDFNGKKIATPQLGNTQDIAARSWFAEKGYKLREKGGTVSLVPLANPDQLTLFQKGEIDGAWTVEPWLSRIELEGGGKLLLEEKSLWPSGHYVTTHFLMSKAFLQKHPALAKKILAAHVEITQLINKDKKAAGRILNDQLSKETGKALKSEIVQQSLDRVELTWDPISDSLHKDAMAAFKVGFIKSQPDLAAIYSLDILNAVLAEKKLQPVKSK